MQLSPNFTLTELTKSATAVRLGIHNEPNTTITDKLQTLAQKILQPVRDHFGPTQVNSGYRSPALNKAVGSKDTSQHIKGEAADFECAGYTNLDVANWIYQNLEFDQLILEFYDPRNPSSGWVHCSYTTHSKNRKQALTITRQGTRLGLPKKDSL